MTNPPQPPPEPDHETRTRGEDTWELGMVSTGRLVRATTQLRTQPDTSGDEETDLTEARGEWAWSGKVGISTTQPVPREPEPEPEDISKVRGEDSWDALRSRHTISVTQQHLYSGDEQESDDSDTATEFAHTEVRGETPWVESAPGQYIQFHSMLKRTEGEGDSDPSDSGVDPAETFSRGENSWMTVRMSEGACGFVLPRTVLAALSSRQLERRHQSSDSSR